MQLTTQQPLSLEEFLELPETNPASEYIDGQVYQKPMPQGKHSILQSRLIAAINHLAVPNQLAYGFTELRCTFGGRSLIPDISVFEWQRLPVNKDSEIANRFQIYPDWVIEILSPKQTDALVIDNILFCLNHGTSLGWLIDPKEKLVVIFQPKQQPEVMRGSDILTVLAVLTDLQLSANELFQWLKVV